MRPCKLRARQAVLDPISRVDGRAVRAWRSAWPRSAAHCSGRVHVRRAPAGAPQLEPACARTPWAADADVHFGPPVSTLRCPLGEHAS